MNDLPERGSSPLISVGDVVRVYNEDDWFYEGRVVEVGQEVIVNFGAWSDAFAPSDMHETWPMMRRILVVKSQGRCVSGVQKSVDEEG